MKMREVGDSTAIDAVGHDAATDTLHVRFHSGLTYRFRGVTSEEHSRLMAADSMGAHFSRHVRPKGGELIKGEVG
jgi:hypothetical protein